MHPSGLRRTPDEIGVIAQLVHRACAPRLRARSLFALYESPFGAPCALAERLHALPGVLVDAR
jgi:hypothetical protein